MRPGQTAEARRALIGLSAAVLVTSLSTSIVNVALPSLVRDLGASFEAAQWTVLAYLLATTALVVGAGRLGDVFGRRRVFLAGVIVFSTASALCTLATTAALLIAARVVQGIGASAMLALATASVIALVPRARAGSAMGLLGSMSAVGTAAGPALGGLLVTAFGWPAVFLVNVPIGAVIFIVAFRSLPADRAESSASRFDVSGTLVLTLTLVAFSLAMTVGRGAMGWVNVALLAAAAIGAAMFVLVEAGAPSPLVDLRSLADPRLRGALWMSLVVSAVMMATLVVGPFYLSLGLGLRPAVAGAIMAIGPVVSTIVGVPAGRAVDRIGPRPVVVGGLFGISAGATLLAVVPSSAGILGYVVPVAVMTASYAAFQAGNNTSVMADLAADRRGVTSGLLNLARSLGLVTGVTLLGAVFSASTGSGDVMTLTPAEAATGTSATFASAAVLAGVAGIAAIRGGRQPEQSAIAGGAWRAVRRALTLSRRMPRGRTPASICARRRHPAAGAKEGTR